MLFPQYQIFTRLITLRFSPIVCREFQHKSRFFKHKLNKLPLPSEETQSRTTHTASRAAYAGNDILYGLHVVMSALQSNHVS